MGVPSAGENPDGRRVGRLDVRPQDRGDDGADRERLGDEPGPGGAARPLEQPPMA
jgi:hypothetical protein